MSAGLDPEIVAFLDGGGYASLDEWMFDSDYVYEDGEWFYPVDNADPEVAGKQVDPIGTIAGAMEAANVPHPKDCYPCKGTGFVIGFGAPAGAPCPADHIMEG